MTVWFNIVDSSLHDDMSGTAQALSIWPNGMTVATPAQIASVQAASNAATIPSPPNPIAVLIAALAAKGIVIAPADLQAAQASLVATPGNATSIQAA